MSVSNRSLFERKVKASKFFTVVLLLLLVVYCVALDCDQILMVVYYGSHQFRRLCKPTCTPKSESCNVRALCELVVVVGKVKILRIEALLHISVFFCIADVSQIFSYLWLKMDRLIRDFKELVALREDNHNHMEDMFIRKLNIESQLLKRIEEQIEVLQERRSEFCPSCLRRSRVKYRNQSAQTPRPKPSTTVIIPGK